MACWLHRGATNLEGPMGPAISRGKLPGESKVLTQVLACFHQHSSHLCFPLLEVGLKKQKNKNTDPSLRFQLWGFDFGKPRLFWLYFKASQVFLISQSGNC